MDIQFQGPLGDAKGLSSAPGLKELLGTLFTQAKLPAQVFVSVTSTAKGTAHLKGINNVSVKSITPNGVEIRAQPGSNTSSRNMVVHTPRGWDRVQLEQALRTAVRTVGKHKHEELPMETDDLDEIVARLHSSMLKAKRPGDWKAAFALLGDAATEVTLVETLTKYRHEVRLSGLETLLDEQELNLFKNALISVKLLKLVKPGKAGNGEHPVWINMVLYTQLTPLVAQLEEEPVPPPADMLTKKKGGPVEEDPVPPEEPEVPEVPPTTKRKRHSTNTFTHDGVGRQQLRQLFTRFGFNPFKANEATVVLKISHEPASRLLYNARHAGILLLHESATKSKAVNVFNAEHEVVKGFMEEHETKVPTAEPKTDDLAAARREVARLQCDEQHALAGHEAARLAANEAQRRLDEAAALHEQCTRELNRVRADLAEAEGHLEALERSHAQAAVKAVKQLAATHGIDMNALLAALKEEVKPAT